MNKDRCGAWMPRAKTYCDSGKGHADNHRSRKSVKQRLAYSKVYVAEHPREMGAYRSRWWRENPDKAVSYYSRATALRRARRLAATYGDAAGNIMEITERMLQCDS